MTQSRTKRWVQQPWRHVVHDGAPEATGFAAASDRNLSQGPKAGRQLPRARTGLVAGEVCRGIVPAERHRAPWYKNSHVRRYIEQSSTAPGRTTGQAAKLEGPPAGRWWWWWFFPWLAAGRLSEARDDHEKCFWGRWRNGLSSASLCKAYNVQKG